MNRRRKSRPSPAKDAPSHSNQPPTGPFRQRSLIICTLLGVLAVGLALANVLRGRLSEPTANQGPAEGSKSEGGSRAAEAGALPFPYAQTPVPETYDELKQETVAVAARLVERYPDTPEAVSLLALVHANLGNQAEASRCWKQWLQRHPEDVEAHYRLGLYANKEGRDEEAVHHLRKAFAIDPRLPDIQAHLGRSLMKLDKIGEALAVLEADIGPAGGGAVRYSTLGHAYLRDQQYEKAKRAFLKAVEIAPAYTGAYYGLATACTKLGQADEAQKHYEEFQKMKTEDAEEIRTKVKQDDLDRLRPMAANWYAAAGKIYARQGDLKQAESHRRRAALVAGARPGD